MDLAIEEILTFYACVVFYKSFQNSYFDRTIIMKILIGPHEVAGYYANLARGFRKMGISVTYFNYERNSNYGGQSTEPKLLLLYKFLLQESNNSIRLSPRYLSVVLVRDIVKFFWVIYAVMVYDFFIFGFGQSLLASNFDLIIIRIFGKRSISNIGHGSDSRPPFLNGIHELDVSMDYNYSKRLVKQSRERLRTVRRHFNFASVVIGFPPSTSFYASGPFVNAIFIGVPYANDDVNTSNHLKIQESRIDRRIKILHAPSNPTAKGSARIVKILDDLIAEGYPIEYQLVMNKSNAEVLRTLLWCDFVIDQLYSDWLLPGFATEAAWHGKPAIIGGYDLEELKSSIREQLRPPSYICHPNNLKEAIVYMVNNDLFRENLGNMAREFVSSFWEASVVANRYLRLLKGDIPKEWFFNPEDVTCINGYGQDTISLKVKLAVLVCNHTIRDLGLSGHPTLQKRILKKIVNQ